tara:strand:+ start:144 stop:296 length:153 start_codon:yes stop_codon:yes gene_type:complete
MVKKKPKNDKKLPLEPKKKADGQFETKKGMVVFETPGPTHTTQGTVDHRR